MGNLNNDKDYINVTIFENIYQTKFDSIFSLLLLF